RMMSLVEADLWVAAAAQLTAHHERDDSREIRLVRQHLQIEHEPCVLRKRRRNASRPFDGGQLARALFLGFLNLPLDVADRIEMLVHLDTIVNTQLLPQVGGAVRNRVEK